MADKNNPEKNNDTGMGGLMWIILLILFSFFMSNSGVYTSEGLKSQTGQIENLDGNFNSFQTVTYTPEDRANLVMLVLCEAGNQSHECQVAVAATVINRVKENYSSTITSVISAPNQFASYYGGQFLVGGYPVTIDYFYDDQICSAESAVNSALNGMDPTNCVGGALYFYGFDGLSEDEAQLRANIQNQIQIDDLYFYREWT